MNLDSILKDYMTTVEAGKLYGVHSRTIRGLIYRNKVEYIKIDSENGSSGFIYMVNKSSLKGYYDTLRNPDQKEINIVEEKSKKYCTSYQDWDDIEYPTKNQITFWYKCKQWLINLIEKC